MTKRYYAADLLPWATDANYPAGADPWSGQPNKLLPSAAVRAVGYVPGKTLPFAWLNHQQGRLFDATIVNMHEAMQSFRGFVAMASPANNGLGGYVTTDAAGFLRIEAVVPYLNDTLSGVDETTFMALGEGSGVWEYKFAALSGHVAAGVTVANITQSIGARACIANGYGVAALVAANGDRDVTKIASDLTSSTASNVVPASHGVAALHYGRNFPALGDRYFLGVYGNTSNTQRIYTSPDGTTWTPRTTPAGWNTVDAVWQFAHAPGTGTILAVGARDALLRSTDNGDTWSEVTAPFNRRASGGPTSLNTYGLAYNQVHGLFMISGDGGGGNIGIAVSADGNTWINRTIGLPPASAFVGTANIQDQRFMLGACGPVFAHIFNRQISVNVSERGVVYTFDGGLNWYRSTFGTFGRTTEPGSLMQGVRAVGSRLVAWDKNHIYVGGLLETPEPVATMS